MSQSNSQISQIATEEATEIKMDAPKILKVEDLVNLGVPKPTAEAMVAQQQKSNYKLEEESKFEEKFAEWKITSGYSKAIAVVEKQKKKLADAEAKIPEIPTEFSKKKLKGACCGVKVAETWKEPARSKRSKHSPELLAKQNIKDAKLKPEKKNVEEIIENEMKEIDEKIMKTAPEKVKNTFNVTKIGRSPVAKDADLRCTLTNEKNNNIVLTRYEKTDILKGDDSVDKYGFDKNFSEKEIIKIAIKYNVNIIVRGGLNAKWYLKGKGRTINELRDKLEQFKGRQKNPNIYSLLIEYD